MLLINFLLGNLEIIFPKNFSRNFLVYSPPFVRAGPIQNITTAGNTLNLSVSPTCHTSRVGGMFRPLSADSLKKDRIWFSNNATNDFGRKNRLSAVQPKEYSGYAACGLRVFSLVII